MVASSFDGALARLLAHEGGYSNHPADPGGPTKFGITIHDYRRYRKPGADAADVRAMKLSEAKAIYRAKYWNAMRCDDLPAGVDYAMFDYGVNSGIGRAGKVLRRVLGLAATSSSITAEVILAVRARDAGEIVAALCDERLAFLKSLRTWTVFGKGWGRRVAEVRAAALALAGQGAAPTPSPPLPGKDAAPAGSRARDAAIGGAVIAGTAAASQAGDINLIVIIVLVTVTLAIGIVAFWRWRQRHLQHK